MIQDVNVKVRCDMVCPQYASYVINARNKHIKLCAYHVKQMVKELGSYGFVQREVWEMIKQNDLR